MLESKRTQIRRELRKEEIEKRMVNMRRALVEGREGDSRQLWMQVQKQVGHRTNMEMVNRLLSYQERHPQDENSYVLISNYLFEHNDSLYAFYSRLVTTPRFLEHHMWSLFIVGSALSQMAVQTEQGEMYQIRDQMEEVLDTACQVLQFSLSHFKQSQVLNEKMLNIWLYFMELLRTVLTEGYFQLFPQKAIALFGQAAQEMQMEERRNEELIATWSCLKEILRQDEKLTDMPQLLVHCWKVFWSVLKELPQERRTCLELMEKLQVKYPVDFMVALFRKEVLSQILYLMHQVPQHKPACVSLLKLVIAESGLEQLIVVLEKGVHRQLTETLEWSMSAGNNQCLEDCLATLYRIMLFLQDQHEAKLLRRVKQEIESLHFDQMLEGLNSQPQNSRVSNLLNLIIDDFYSSEEP